MEPRQSAASHPATGGIDEKQELLPSVYGMIPFSLVIADDDK